MPTVVYRVARSRRAFVNAPKVRAILEAALDDEAKPHFTKELEKRVANWKHKPDFQDRKFTTADAIRVYIYPVGANKQIYVYVTEGTRAHPITVRRAKFLAFMWGGPGSYKAKTGPGGTYGGPGTVTGGKMTFRKQVQHPGFPGRHFEKHVCEDNKPWFAARMEAAWKRAIREMSKSA